MLRGGVGAAGDRPEVLVDELPGRLLVEIADQDQGRVVRLVIGVVEALAFGRRDLLQILDRADGRPAVGVLGVGERAELLDRLADRIVVDAQALLLLDDVALGVDRRRKELQVPHPLRLQLQREPDVRRRHRVVVGGQILGGEGVDLPAHLLQQPGVLLGRNVLGPLEHHVLEHVGDAANADVLVLRSDVIENLHRRDGRLVIGEEEHLQPVRQRPALDVQLGRRHRRGGGGRRLGGLAGPRRSCRAERQRQRQHRQRNPDSRRRSGHGRPDYDTLTARCRS